MKNMKNMKTVKISNLAAVALGIAILMSLSVGCMITEKTASITVTPSVIEVQLAGNTDSDGDGYTDIEESQAGTNPALNTDYPSWLPVDADLDGYSDQLETITRPDKVNDPTGPFPQHYDGALWRQEAFTKNYNLNFSLNVNPGAGIVGVDRIKAVLHGSDSATMGIGEYGFHVLAFGGSEVSMPFELTLLQQLTVAKIARIDHLEVLLYGPTYEYSTTVPVDIIVPPSYLATGKTIKDDDWDNDGISNIIEDSLNSDPFYDQCPPDPAPTTFTSVSPGGTVPIDTIHPVYSWYVESENLTHLPLAFRIAVIDKNNILNFWFHDAINASTDDVRIYTTSIYVDNIVIDTTGEGTISGLNPDSDYWIGIAAYQANESVSMFQVTAVWDGQLQTSAGAH